MLSTLIYRSRLSVEVALDVLEQVVARAKVNNEKINVTGILLFDGEHFFQVLEGSVESVNAVYDRISKDTRHYNLVELLRDYAPSRRFGNAGMELFDLRCYDKASVLQAVLAKGTSQYALTYDDRVLKFIRTFVAGNNKEAFINTGSSSRWDLIQQPAVAPQKSRFMQKDQACQFALQPIVDVANREIISFEALIRSAEGGSPATYFASLSKDQLYQADVESKRTAFALAKHIGLVNQTLSVNLLPMSLVMNKGAVDFLLEEIKFHGLVPEQVVVEVTEDEVISRFDEFEIAINQLRSAGIGLAIDDFGAGFAGLSLLAQFQPEKIKIDRNIICDVHKSGPKQAIVQAMIKCCSLLEISVIAEGVEKIEEWLWLEAAGIRYFQGFLFARPQLNGLPAVNWPEKKKRA
ncbi:diguanylate phosphodiesterase [Pantoea sp. LMR881]|uniref:diguanylate phosphodiesterase n=1 Tax=Pantoea sp. LMR881 TaxID=3014336 RepID=UPI0022AE6B4A|nr:diguanylate phosphodiesterase [Pantoea sp. LMR881]MCZ4057905.1 diguanylate phosphodiesterase [Pantoea sp. LMR881]